MLLFWTVAVHHFLIVWYHLRTWVSTWRAYRDSPRPIRAKNTVINLEDGQHMADRVEKPLALNYKLQMSQEIFLKMSETLIHFLILNIFKSSITLYTLHVIFKFTLWIIVSAFCLKSIADRSCILQQTGSACAVYLIFCLLCFYFLIKTKTWSKKSRSRTKKDSSQLMKKVVWWGLDDWLRKFIKIDNIYLINVILFNLFKDDFI